MSLCTELARVHGLWNRSRDERLVSILGFLFGMRAKVGLLGIQDAFAGVPRRMQTTIDDRC